MAQDRDSNEQINIERKVGTLIDHLQTMPKNMGTFAKSLQSLYYHRNLRTSMAEHSCHVVQEYKKIRSETRDDAFIYLFDHLHKVEELITSIQNFF